MNKPATSEPSGCKVPVPENKSEFDTESETESDRKFEAESAVGQATVACNQGQAQSGNLPMLDEERSSQLSIRLAHNETASKSCPISGGQQPVNVASNGMSITRQQLSARVKTITGKLLESHGAELRRTLFSLKQIFQDDSELATEFVESDGLECLLKVVKNADQIHQNYILRALGQLISYSAGMNALRCHNETIQWLYTLLSSPHRLVAKTSIRLLLLFIEQNDTNCLHFCHAIKSVEQSKDCPLWKTVIDLFNNKDKQQDVALLVDAMTLINKTLAGIPDQDTYYDLVDPLEELGIESIMKKCANLDNQLREQFELYEQVLKTEDQDNDSSMEIAEQDMDKMQSKMLNSNNDNARGLNSNSSSSSDGNSQLQVDEVRRRSKRADRLQQVDERASGQQQVVNNDLSNEDNYVSANESNESSKSAENTQPIVEEPRRSPRVKLPQEELMSRSGNVIKQNLARGKQQRASISSCSSSDSYASYGSGYASGSGNSTDHEHKQKSLANTNEEGAQVSAEAAQNNNLKSKKDVNQSTDNGGEEVDDDSQLRQHLSELEQLTDELASRNIFGTLTQPIQSTSKHFSSTIKSISSNSSSILSTGSDVSSCLSNTPGTNEPLQVVASPAAAAAPDCESRSASATPTALSVNAQCSDMGAISSTPLSSSSSKSQLPHNSRVIKIAGDAETAHQSQITRPQHQFTSPASSNVLSSQQKQQPQQASSSSSSLSPAKQEPYYHNLFQWEQLVSKGVTRPLLINDLDFTDLRDEDDCDLLNNSNGNALNRARNQATGEPLTISIPENHQHIRGTGIDSNSSDSIDSGTGTGSPKSRAAALQSGSTPASAPPPMPPPPISPWFNTIAGSRPQSQFMSSPSPPYEYNTGSTPSQQPNEFNRDQSPANSTYSNYSRNSVCVAQSSTPIGDSSSKLMNHHQYNTLQPLTSLRSASSMSSLLFGNNGKYANKRKKTMKLFWKEVREDRSLLSKLTRKRTIWDEIKPVQVDTQKLEHLFESKAKDLLLSKSRNGLDGLNQRKVKITVLDAKRSNAINIGMTKLPPMRTIKNAILKMDSSIMNREGIEKILTTMMPSEEEKSRIIEAQLANPDTPLGTAEQFLLNLASISALEARLKLWAFQLDYAQIEKEVAEPLMDLKQAIGEIERSETFRIILGALLAIGNFLNSTNVKGFQIDYLEKVPEVKDTVHKHSLLHHLCLFIQEKYGADSTSDLYSEFSAVNRASKVDYTEVAKNLKKMQLDCKASWDYLKIVAKHDGLANLMNTCGSNNISTTSENGPTVGQQQQQQLKSSGKLNNLSKLSMITTVMSSDGGSSSSTNASSSSASISSNDQHSGSSSKQLKTKVSDFLTDCAERIMVLIVIHRRVMNRFQKLLVYLGCPSHQIKQTQPQQILKIINEFALEYRTKRERVREMLLKKSQCQHHNHNHRRWQLNRSSRWAGSQQCLDSLGYNQNHNLNRPCSTTSSCASSYATNQICTDSMCNISLAGDSAQHHQHHHANQQQVTANHRANSPSGFSQISNYSDYLFDQSSLCCNSRQQSITPVPSEKNLLNQQQQQNLIRRPHSMSISMFDLQNQQQNSCLHSSASAAAPNTSCKATLTTGNRLNEGVVDNKNNGEQLARQKDEQLRLLLGAGKSFDETCNELYQMSHWSSTMARVHRHPPIVNGSKQRANSMDSPNKDDDELEASRQSSYYRYLHNGRCINDDVDDREQNSDDEILQSLVRTATAKSTHNSQNGSKSSNNSSPTNKRAKKKILSRFNCDRKSFRRTLRSGIELSNVG